MLNSPIGGTLYTWLNGGSRALAFKAWSCAGDPLEQPYEYLGGNFLNASNKYLALRLHVESQVYFGWVQLSVAGGVTNATIFDYAYNASPNQTILSGQTMTTGIVDHSFVLSINLFPNPADNHLTIDLGNHYGKSHVTIVDISGKLIFNTTAIDAQRVEVNTKDFTKGMYILQVQAAGFIGTKKFVVEE